MRCTDLYNQVFKQYIKPESILDEYGCQTPYDWEDIITEASAEIVMLAPPTQVQFLQIKEKFNGLRFYVSFTKLISEDDKYKIGDIIRKAEHDIMTLENKDRS
jgi:hypothetical protein